MTDQFHFLLMQTFNMTNRAMHSLTSQMGIDPGQPKILQVLYGSDGMIPKEIAALCRLDKSTAMLLIKRMIESGLLNKTPSVEDRRSVVICLTDKGKDLAVQVLKAGDRVDEDALKDFDASEIRELTHMLERVQKTCRQLYEECNASVYCIWTWSDDQFFRYCADYQSRPWRFSDFICSLCHFTRCSFSFF